MTLCVIPAPMLGPILPDLVHLLCTFFQKSMQSCHFRHKIPVFTMTFTMS